MMLEYLEEHIREAFPYMNLGLSPSPPSNVQESKYIFSIFFEGVIKPSIISRRYIWKENLKINEMKIWKKA